MNNTNFYIRNKMKIPPGIEPGTVRVLGGRDNHYTTESQLNYLKFD